jgi:hypothetical protein
MGPGGAVKVVHRRRGVRATPLENLNFGLWEGVVLHCLLNLID